jgi:hypothetical protein
MRTHDSGGLAADVAMPMIAQPPGGTDAADPLEDIGRLLDAGEHRAAWAAMTRFLGNDPGTASCQAVGDLATRVDAAQAELVEMRVALLGNVTLDLLGPVHVARGLSSRLLIRPLVAPYDTWAQELLDPNGSLQAFDPHVVILALRPEALTPALTTGFLDLDAAGVQREIDVVVERIGTALEAVRARSKAKVLLHSLPTPVDRSLGIVDAVHGQGQTAVLRTLNERLQSLANDLGDTYVVDIDWLVARVGWSRWYDPRMDGLRQRLSRPSTNDPSAAQARCRAGDQQSQ